LLEAVLNLSNFQNTQDLSIPLIITPFGHLVSLHFQLGKPMMIRLLKLLPLCPLFISPYIQAQTIIYSNPGASYNNTDGVTTDTYGPANIANCSSISFSIDYNFSLPYGGPFNMESSDECPFGIPPCQGDPNDPSGGGCDQCWDFFYVQFQIDGVTMNTKLVGVPGNTNQSGTLTFGPVCTDAATEAGFVVQTQTWAADETITFSNLQITCWDASASSLTANPDPVCEGSPFTLTAALTDPSGVASTLWTSTSWSNGAITPSIQVNPSITSTYTATVTENGCAASSSVTVVVNQPTAATIHALSCDPAQVGTTTSTIPNAAGCDSIITTVTTLDIPGCAPTAAIADGAVTCFGDLDGILTLSATGGLEPYQYSWSNGVQGGSGSIHVAGSPTQIQNLAAGSYTVTITAANGLTSTVLAVIVSPTMLTAQVTAQPIFGQNAISCNGATDALIHASTIGGTPPFQYSWNVAGQNTPTLTGIGAGTYIVIVTDARQCSATSSTTILDPPPLAFDIALESVKCGDISVPALIIPINGNSPFSVNIDGVLASGGLMPSISEGNHLVEIRDANGCLADTTITLSLPPAPIISLPAEATVSFGETLVLEAQTNLSNWQSLSWAPPADSSCPHCLQQAWAPVSSGQYEVVITDYTGCTASALVRVIVNQEIALYVPNVFSPNGDGLNDFWALYAGESVLTLNALQIFDRWGEMLYLWETPVSVNAWPGWDGDFRGKPVNPGVFV